MTDAQSNTSALQVLVDARKLGDGGIGSYIENLVDGLLEFENEVQISALVSTKRRELPERWRGRVRTAEERAGKYSLAEYLLLAIKHRALLKTQSIFHSPHYTLPFFLNMPSVVTIHDVIHYTHPETSLHRPLSGLMIRSALNRASHVITVSKSARDRLVESFGEQKVPVSVIPNAVSLQLEQANEQTKPLDPSLSENYWLFVGSERAHKGFVELIQAYDEVGELLEMLSKRPKLVFVGSRYSADAKLLVERMELSEHVVFLGEVPSAELGRLYRNASAVIVPSQEEGFGLVALEAMYCGVPVVCSPAPSLREVCGEAAWYAQDFEPATLSKVLYFMVNDDELRTQKVKVGLQRARKFTRRFVASRTIDVYHRVLGLPPRLEVNTAEAPDFAGLAISGGNGKH